LIHFDSIIETVEKQVKELLEIKKIKLIVSIQVKEKQLFIEEELLIRVLVNLINNAIKFSYPNSEIYLKVQEENANLVISVLDKGIGFDQSNVQDLFRKFTKMSQLGTSNEASTGIGLYLCRKIVEKNQGKLTGISAGQNKGAVFSITFNG
jgi:signal transduction histidine kinase